MSLLELAADVHGFESMLPSRELIRAASPPCLVVTKLEAFAVHAVAEISPRSRDFGDVISLIDGRE